MVRQQQAQAITPPPAGVHIGTEAFAVAGTKLVVCFEVDQGRRLRSCGWDCEPRLCDKGLVREQLRPSDFLMAFF